MKRKKKVSDAVLAANRANSQSSSGPRTEHGKSNSSKNALRHGILARKVEFDDDEQRAEFLELWQVCKTELHPIGLIEKFLVEEIATLLWKLGITAFLEVRELLRRQGLSDDVSSVLHKDLELPIRNLDLPRHLPLDRGWDYERVVVRTVATKDHHHSTAVRGPGFVQGHVVEALKSSENSDNKNVDHLEIEAVMGSALESVTRYQAKLKRDL